MKEYREKLDALLKAEVDEGRVPGVSAMVLHKGKEIYSGAFGMADMEREYPMKKDTIIRLFSMTKPITSAAVMILAERGMLALEDAVEKYLPEFRGQTVWKEGEGEVPADRPLTLADLMYMTSGIPYPDDSHESGRRIGKMMGELINRRLAGETVTTRDYMKEIAKVPLRFQPGERWMYGLSADVLGAVVEVVSGLRYSEFLKKEIFDPLNMPDTAFFVPEEKKDRFAQIYLFNQQLGKVAPSYDCHLAVYYGEDVAFESGGAGLVSTLEDYSHFAMMMVNKGVYNGVRILKEETIAFMTKNVLREDQKEEFTWPSLEGYGYGCLMRTLTDPEKEGAKGNIGTFGWDGWTGNFVVMDPVEEAVYLFYIQRGDAWVLPVVKQMRVLTAEMLEKKKGM